VGVQGARQRGRGLVETPTRLDEERGDASVVAELILVSFVTLIYTYMLGLIRDVDGPFEYSATGARGAAEVDLFPLDEHIARSGRE
jgi:hypothetical protein